MTKNPSDQMFSEDQDPAGGEDDAPYLAPDQPMGAQSWGTTWAEERRGELFSQRSKHVQPEDTDNPGYDPLQAGQLVQPGDEDVDRFDDEASVVALDSGHNYDGDVSAEEAAMHIVEDRS